MRGPSPKEGAIRRGGPGPKPDSGLPEDDELRDPPQLPKGYLTRTKEIWAGFWASRVSLVVDDADLPALFRWIGYVDEHRRVTTRLRDDPDSIALNSRRKFLEENLTRLEERFGMTPASRVRLGIGKRKLKRSSVAGLREGLRQSSNGST